MHKYCVCLNCIVPIYFAFSIIRNGTKWQETRRKHGKQLTPANVVSYIPGFNRATDRLIRNIKELQDDEGYVNNMEELIMYWSLEGLYI